jgi:hypothetical protein
VADLSLRVMEKLLDGEGEGLDPLLDELRQMGADASDPALRQNTGA